MPTTPPPPFPPLIHISPFQAQPARTPRPTQQPSPASSPAQPSPSPLLAPARGAAPTPATTAVVNDRLALLKQAIAGLPHLLNAPDDRSATPLMLAVREGRRAAFRWLIQQPGLSLDALDERGETALLKACDLLNGGPYIRALLQAGANPSVRSCSGRSCLMAAAFRGAVDTVALLLANDLTDAAAVSAQSAGGETALHCAVRRREGSTIQIVSWLLEAGCDPLLADRLGQTPLAQVQACPHMQPLPRLVQMLWVGTRGVDG
jgi:ankyrin repeat protein